MSKKHSPDANQREMRRDVWKQQSCRVYGSIEGWRCVGTKGQLRFACHQERWDDWRAKQSTTPKDTMTKPKGITEKQAKRITDKALARQNNPVTKAVVNRRIADTARDFIDSTRKPLPGEGYEEHDFSEMLNGTACGIAYRVAVKADPLAPGQGYLEAARTDPQWTPHAWVVDAIVKGLEVGIAMGKAEGLTQANAEHQLIHDAVAEKQDTQSTSYIRACVAAVLEGVTQSLVVTHADGPRREVMQIQVTMNLEAQRTIWDRFELTTERSVDETEVTFKLFRKE